MKRVALAVTALTLLIATTSTNAAQPPRDRPGGSGVDAAAFDAPPLPKDDAREEDPRRHGRDARRPAIPQRLRRRRTPAAAAWPKRSAPSGSSRSAPRPASRPSGSRLALRTTGGHLFTHEIDPERAKIAQENFKKAGVDDLITIVVGDAHETVKQHKEPIDILFLDADKEGYIDYLDKLVPLIRPGRADHRPQHEPPPGRPALPEGDHQEPQAGNAVPARWKAPESA